MHLYVAIIEYFLLRLSNTHPVPVFVFYIYKHIITQLLVALTIFAAFEKGVTPVVICDTRLENLLAFSINFLWISRTLIRLFPNMILLPILDFLAVCRVFQLISIAVAGTRFGVAFVVTVATDWVDETELEVVLNPLILHTKISDVPPLLSEKRCIVGRVAVVAEILPVQVGHLLGHWVAIF